MRILGIHDAIDSAAAILEDGRVKAAIAEERVIRAKLAFGFPREAITAVLAATNLQPNDIDYVAVATRNNYLVNRIVPFKGWYETRNGSLRRIFLPSASALSPLARKFSALERLYYSSRYPIFAHRRWKIARILRDEFGLSCPIEYVDHHYAHACSTYYSSGYEDATVVTLDGGGDGLSSSVSEVRNGMFTKLADISSLNSIGNFYSYVTHICGFTTHKHEGKITGLAAYGEPEYLDVFKDLIDYHDGKIINTSKLFAGAAISAIKSKLPNNFKRENLACSIQQHLEDVVIQYIEHWMKKTQPRELAVAGGVFANVKLNQKILEKVPDVASISIHPAMGDDGIAVGAALALYYSRHHGNTRKDKESRCFDHVYLGPEFSEAEIRSALDGNKLSYSYHHEIESVIARLLAKGHVVARFNGRMEYGPRALGNRSILYQATDPTVNDWLNKNLRRTEFMPFAPSTLAEFAHECYLNMGHSLDTARFMTITVNCTESMKKHCPGVVHVDGTARPQLVIRDDNPSYHKIISEYHKLTGLPSIINTSFNIHEEPIVCTPNDAIRAFEVGNLDYLAIGNFLVKNASPTADRVLKPSGDV